MQHRKSILVTGASGFIGSFLIEQALVQGFDTWAGIRNSSSKEYLQDERIRFINLNFADKNILIKQLSEFKEKYGKFNYIIHNAGVTKCYDKKHFDKVNFQNTANLIDALIESDSIPLKFVLISSLSVMGNNDEKTYKPFKIEDIPNPNTNYGKSKLKAEEYLRKQTNFPYLIFRPTGVYGPREHDYLLMIKTVKSGLDIGVGFKPQHLTFIYIKDLVSIIFKGAISDYINKIYFVTDGYVYTDKEYTNIIKRVLGKKRVISFKVPICLLKAISFLGEFISQLIKKPLTLNRDKYKIMKQKNWECDISLLKDDLGFSPEYKLEDGIIESIDWYKKNNWI